ncbi:uncharacterized protein LOC109721661 isoform X2 [Ananas comosus]|uniref:Uncharacterized protein LOC109721661 isoform X2 n=1 Tax=Ananas comosus TaxID=4615 RepID=A0A6P5GI31_ANACO|nr:uncharacterized protein LOC109721661 isoform X2 [Ananas comosus]XP_020104970.1 uncharacterized protein LOC109721661 isoform X2 [Ananas comosus]XP_020104971.1 uncharacterized protein LOC109721661 isoform X2 [Ananas comosus]
MAVYAKHPIPSIRFEIPTRWSSIDNMAKVYLRVPLIVRMFNKQKARPQIVAWSKNSSFQDFQVFAKPSHLLPASEATTYSKFVPEEIFSSLELDKSDSLYIVELRTSRDFGSCLRDMNAAILLCLIDVNGVSLLQRIPSISLANSGQDKEMSSPESVHFRRGSADVVTFKGSKLGKIEALWIGLESGSWRVDGVHLTVINGTSTMPKFSEETSEVQFDGLQCKFEANNILLGEGGVSMAELRPVLAEELHGNTFPHQLNAWSSSNIFSSHEMSNEDGMREYADLKLSLLLYDLILISTGFTTFTLCSNEKAAYSFLVGGIGGFLYLLLLQRSVDGLSATESASGEAFGGLKRPWLGLALIMAASVVAVKYGIGGNTVALTPTDLFIGVAGFLASKIAVVLAAFRPIQRSPKRRD